MCRAYSFRSDISLSARAGSRPPAADKKFRYSGRNDREFVILECGNRKLTIAPRRRLIGGIEDEVATIAGARTTQ
jgi:hypothetical protein